MKSSGAAAYARFRAGRIVAQTRHYIGNEGRVAVVQGDFDKVNKWMGTIRIISGLRSSDREQAIREIILQIQRVKEVVLEGVVYVPVNSKAPFYARRELGCQRRPAA
jgi:hypothetical protein